MRKVEIGDSYSKSTEYLLSKMQSFYLYNVKKKYVSTLIPFCTHSLPFSWFTLHHWCKLKDAHNLVNETVSRWQEKEEREQSFSIDSLEVCKINFYFPVVIVHWDAC